MIGPGLVLAGGSIGTGEWVMGPQAAARYHGAMLWVVIVSIAAQVVLNTEVMRYTVCTGEPVMTGFLRTKPGPKFWLLFYLLLDFSGWLPSLAGLASQILVVAFLGLTPQDSINPALVNQVSIGVFLFCAVLVLFGGKVYSSVKLISSSKLIYSLAYLSFVCIFFVSARVWSEIFSGLINPFKLPVGKGGHTEFDMSLIAALGGFAGVGGLGNIMVSNFVRENGWGMGKLVGAIPSAFGGHKIELSHIGTIYRPGPGTLERFKGWYHKVIKDQYWLWAAGSLVGMVLPCALGLQYLNVMNLEPGADQWRWAAALAQDFGASKGEIFKYLTLFCGLMIMMPGQFYVIDGVARRWTDAIWSGSRRIRKVDKGRIKHVYYAFVAAYVIWGVSIFLFWPDLSATAMMKFTGSLANLTIAVTILQTLYVNRHFLPPEARPSAGKQAAMLVSALFFLIMFALVVNQKVVPILKQFPTHTATAVAVVVGGLLFAAYNSRKSVACDQ